MSDNRRRVVNLLSLGGAEPVGVPSEEAPSVLFEQSSRFCLSSHDLGGDGYFLSSVLLQLPFFVEAGSGGSFLHGDTSF